MLQVNTIRQNPEVVKEKLAVKYFAEPNLVDDIIALDDERKKLTFAFDETKAQINSTSKEIGQLMAKGQKRSRRRKKEER